MVIKLVSDPVLMQKIKVSRKSSSRAGTGPKEPSPKNGAGITPKPASGRDRKTRTKRPSIAVSLSDILLARKLFGGNSGRYSVEIIRKLIAGNIPSPSSFLIEIPDSGNGCELLEEAMRTSGSLVYFLKKEFGDSFTVSPDGIEAAVRALGHERAMDFLSVLGLPASMTGHDGEK